MSRILNADPIGKYAIQGYDPVAFHTVKKPVKGDPYISAEAIGYKFLFANEENKKLFEKDPEKYIPAFGGYCAFGVALGVFFPVEIDTWDMDEGRVFFQFSQAIKDKFNENRVANLAKAKENWAKVEAR
jgi:YHS domain-containing protein